MIDYSHKKFTEIADCIQTETGVLNIGLGESYDLKLLMNLKQSLGDSNQRYQPNKTREETEALQRLQKLGFAGRNGSVVFLTKRGSKCVDDLVRVYDHIIQHVNAETNPNSDESK